MAGLLGAVVLVMKTMTANLVERSHEIGILKAVGWTQKLIARQLTVEAFLQAFSNGVLGILARFFIYFRLEFLFNSIPVPWGLNPLTSASKQLEAASELFRLPVSVS
jgi:ABC-type antimicrobial peptide transport system permease subunit